jgi:ActR/RegA family two-component response regulator
MTVKANQHNPAKMALVVHSDMGLLSSFQSALSEKGFVTIVARDLPTALLAITHHYFDVAIVSSKLGEGGDGWPLAGVLHLVFPRAFVGVLSPNEPDVLTLQSAINYGVREVFLQSHPPQEVVGTLLSQLEAPAEKTRSRRLQ